MDPAWVIPAAGQAFKNRQDIASGWSRLLALLLGKKSQLVVTGMAGSGKTVLLDHLSGVAFSPEYEPPEGKSPEVDRKKLRRPGQRLGFAVIPGQEDGPNRLLGFDELFLGKKPVAGVIHVVCFGYNETRGEFAKEALEEIDLQTLRERRLKQELEDLRATCAVIRSSWTRFRVPLWMLVVVNKVDLYEDKLDEARRRYSERSEGEFVETIQELRENIGKDNFGWQAIPGCSWLESFRWGDQVVETKLVPSQRNQLLKGIEDAAISRCERARLR